MVDFMNPILAATIFLTIALQECQIVGLMTTSHHGLVINFHQIPSLQVGYDEILFFE
jgi:ABC-type xylose transport system permease subunit